MTKSMKLQFLAFSIPTLLFLHPAIAPAQAITTEQKSKNCQLLASAVEAQLGDDKTEGPYFSEVKARLQISINLKAEADGLQLSAESRQNNNQATQDMIKKATDASTHEFIMACHAYNLANDKYRMLRQLSYTYECSSALLIPATGRLEKYAEFCGH